MSIPRVHWESCRDGISWIWSEINLTCKVVIGFWLQVRDADLMDFCWIFHCSRQVDLVNWSALLLLQICHDLSTYSLKLRPYRSWTFAALRHVVSWIVIFDHSGPGRSLHRHQHLKLLLFLPDGVLVLTRTWSARNLRNTFLLTPVFCSFETFLITMTTVSVWTSVTVRRKNVHLETYRISRLCLCVLDSSSGARQ